VTTQARRAAPEPGTTPEPLPPGQTPASRGYRMPAEWERHRGTWLSWPHRESSWPGRFERVPPVIAEMVRHLAPGEEVHINVADSAMEAGARRVLEDAEVPVTNVFFHHFPTNDAWCRDHGPIFLQRRHNGEGEELILNWGYNAWGDKYPPFDLDDLIPDRIAEHLGIPVVYPGIVMEGGSLDVNGCGTLLTTESCLLNPNRNPGLTREAIEQILSDHLGVTQILWLGDGIEGDDTDGHVDDITRFVDPTTVVTVLEDNPADRNYAPLLENYLRLQAMTDQSGDPLRIVTLPMPTPLWYEGQRVPASYANFYIGNEVVLLPAYDPPTTRAAEEVLAPLFPGRRIVPIDCQDLIWGLGAFHCLTQQVPATMINDQ